MAVIEDAGDDWSAGVSCLVSSGLSYQPFSEDMPGPGDET